MALREEINEKSAQIKTDSYPMSIGELVNLYRDGELDVHPEFQRVYRWTNTQKTKLIESILLGIPIPPIFVAQRVDGVWDVVDGVQRLSTIFQFMGELKGERGEQLDELELEETKFLPSLKGKTWSGENPFPTDLQRYIKRAKIDVNIVLKESDAKSKYELFMRLNTGGTALEAQEVRNCLMLMAYPETYWWILNLSGYAPFLNSISLSDRNLAEQYHMELATRFLTFRTIDSEQMGKLRDIGEFLDDHLEFLHAMNPAQKATEERAFRETFDFIHKEMESDAFRRFDIATNRFLGGFSISGFEAVALGVGFHVARNGGFPDIRDLRGKVQSIWSNPEFFNNSGSGVRASTRIPKIVPMGRELFAP